MKMPRGPVARHPITNEIRIKNMNDGSIQVQIDYLKLQFGERLRNQIDYLKFWVRYTAGKIQLSFSQIIETTRP